jgi:hypothetical protein
MGLDGVSPHQNVPLAVFEENFHDCAILTRLNEGRRTIGSAIQSFLSGENGRGDKYYVIGNLPVLRREDDGEQSAQPEHLRELRAIVG